MKKGLIITADLLGKVAVIGAKVSAIAYLLGTVGCLIIDGIEKRERSKRASK